MIRTADGRLVPDNLDRGLWMLAWSRGRPVQCVSRGVYAGMTAPEIAERVGCSIDHVRACLTDGEIPRRPPTPGRKISEEAIERRRRAGIPEHLLHHPAHAIARELGVSENHVTSAIYRNGRLNSGR